MEFILGPMLIGLVLVGIPVLLHLIMRQKPKHLLFPAFRFLLQKHRTNQRRLKLRHLLLLLLRMLLIAGVCLALARPRVFNERLNFSAERPVVAVLIMDTSPSMEYAVAGRTRLDEAKRRAQELLTSMPAGSHVAVLDSGDIASGQWQLSPARAAEQVAALKIRSANGPVNAQLTEAYRLVRDLDLGEEESREKLPRFIHVFSDRAADSWDASRQPQLQEMRQSLEPLIVNEVFFDVGADQPADLAITQIELPRQAVPANVPVVLNATVQATGADYDTEIICRFDGEDKPERKPLRLLAGQSQVVRFERSGLPPGLHQAEISLATSDSLPFNNVAFATCEVRGPRQVLVVCDNPASEQNPKGDDILLKPALTRIGFKADVVSTAEATKYSLRDLTPYQVVCLINVSQPSSGLWERLEQYVAVGGGLAVIPGGLELENEASLGAYNDAAAQRLQPARLVKVVAATDEGGAVWKEATFQHPAMAPFREWRQQVNTDFVKFPPRAFRYWEVAPYPDEHFLLGEHEDKEPRPALLERKFDRGKVRGRVLLFTVPMDGHTLSEKDLREWTTYNQNSFGLVLIGQTIGYLAGNLEDENFNFRCGLPVPIILPAEPRLPTYNLYGPGLAGSDTVVTREDRASTLTIRQAVTPGNFTLSAADGRWKTGFSLMIAPVESELAKVPEQAITDLFGPDAVVPLTRELNLRTALQERWPQPVELLPWLMILVLLVLAVENLLANKFYRRAPANPEGGAS
jgi:hypothetical protein